MSAIPSNFETFLSNIRLTPAMITNLKEGHERLRNRLTEYEGLSDIIVTTFLQGSYRRHTAVKPKNGKRADVDVIVVINVDKDEYTPQEVLDAFVPFLDKYYAGKWKPQGRSFGIELSNVDLDVVPAVAPSEAVQDALKNFYSLLEGFDLVNKSAESIPQWKQESLWIPDREVGEWVETNPLAQIEWTREKNATTDGRYVNVVKALKWWQKVNHPDMRPKGYPLEHFIGQCCPDDIESVAEGVVLTLENIHRNYPLKPVFQDHGIEGQSDVFSKVTLSQYADFYKKITVAAESARVAFDETDYGESIRLWNEFFASDFPKPPEKQGFTKREEKSTDVPTGRFA